MIDKLAELLENFPGPSNRTRCFLHIINLVTKTLLKQFDLPKKAAEDALDDAEKELLDLAEGLDSEPLASETSASELGDEENEPQNDNMEGWVDEMQKLSEDERVELMDEIQPIKLVLVKVSNDSELKYQ
jgi:uncharacterized protein with von Willebrand factor type A (vWA) domain